MRGGDNEPLLVPGPDNEAPASADLHHGVCCTTAFVKRAISGVST